MLSVTLVHCGQTVGLIKMPLGTKVGLGPGHIVLDGDLAPHPKRGTAPNFLPMFVVSRCHLVWIEVGLGGSALATLCICIGWGPSSTKRTATQQTPIFGTSVVAKRSPISSTAELLYHAGIILRAAAVT